VSGTTLQPNEQILHQMNINGELLEVSDYQLIMVYIHGSDLHGLQAMAIYMYLCRIKHVVQGVEMYGFPSISHSFSYTM
jgi:predicted Ser/Thr protein kinase